MSPDGPAARSSGCWRLTELQGDFAEVRRALEEDPTRLLGAAARRPACARFVAEDRFVVAGLPTVSRVYAELEAAARVEELSREGTWVSPGAVIARVRARAGTLLSGGRVALNFLQPLSGCATLTRRVVEAVEGTGARITPTRKTTPGGGSGRRNGGSDHAHAQD